MASILLTRAPAWNDYRTPTDKNVGSKYYGQDYSFYDFIDQITVLEMADLISQNFER